MSKSSSRSRKKKSGGKRPRSQTAHDRAVYIALLMIGAFIVLLAVPLTGGTAWRHVALGYLVLLAIMLNLFTWRAYRGAKLARWQAALARLPLRWVGFGVKGGKPIAAAHDRPEVRTMVVVCGILSLIMLGVLAVVLLPGIL